MKDSYSYLSKYDHGRHCKVDGNKVLLRMVFAVAGKGCKAVVKYSLRISMKCRMKSGVSSLYLNVHYLTVGPVVYG